MTEPITGTVEENAAWYKQRFEALNKLVDVKQQKILWCEQKATAYDNLNVADLRLVEQKHKTELAEMRTLHSQEAAYEKELNRVKFITHVETLKSMEETERRLISSLELRLQEVHAKNVALDLLRASVSDYEAQVIKLRASVTLIEMKTGAKRTRR